MQTNKSRTTFYRVDSPSWRRAKGSSAREGVPRCPPSPPETTPTKPTLATSLGRLARHSPASLHRNKGRKPRRLQMQGKVVHHLKGPTSLHVNLHHPHTRSPAPSTHTNVETKPKDGTTTQHTHTRKHYRAICANKGASASTRRSLLLYASRPVISSEKAPAAVQRFAGQTPTIGGQRV